jgi:hypothetical protein
MVERDKLWLSLAGRESSTLPACLRGATIIVVVWKWRGTGRGRVIRLPLGDIEICNPLIRLMTRGVGRLGEK